VSDTCRCGHSLDYHTWSHMGSDEEFIGMCAWFRDEGKVDREPDDEGCHCSDYVPREEEYCGICDIAGHSADMPHAGMEGES
jgi:hypothetical protein